MNNSKLKIRNFVLTFVLILICSSIYFIFWDDTIIFFRFVLESKVTHALTWIIIFCVFLTHYLINRDNNIKTEPIFNQKYGNFADSLFGFIGYGITITSSLTIIKGLYIQNLFSDAKYFLEFDKLDMISIFCISSYLLYYSIMKIIEIVKSTYINFNAQEVKPDLEKNNI